MDNKMITESKAEEMFINQCPECCLTSEMMHSAIEDGEHIYWAQDQGYIVIDDTTLEPLEV